MKKLLILNLLLIIPFFCLSQTKLPTIKSDSFKWEEKEQKKTFDVNFKYFLKDVVIPQERLNSVIMNAIVQCKFKLKNRLSFRPIEVNIYSTENDLNIFVKYGGKNAFGVEMLSQSYFTFKNEEEINLQHILTN